MEELLNDYSQYYMHNFGLPKLVLQRGKGSIVTDVSGKEYIDLLAGIAVNTLGHCPEVVVNAVSNQVRKLLHVSNYFATPEQVKLAKELVKLVEGQARVLLVNSGTEANEGALKIVKKHAWLAKQPDATIIALESAFHGRTTGGLSATYRKKYREPFHPLLPNIKFIPANDIKALKAAFAEPVAGVFIETLQGEAGVIELETNYIQSVRELTRKHNALMVVDEVQTGIGRTGKYFSYQHHNVRPDIVTTAKGLGGGFPIGAIIAFDDAGEILQPGDHGTTFGGNPLAASAALAVLGEIKSSHLLIKAADVLPFVQDVFNSLKNQHITQIRGRGALVALELEGNRAAEVANLALNNGLIVNSVTESAIRIAPALNIDLTVLNRGLKILDKSIKEVYNTIN
jgi:acetylornithine aminotransferase